MDKRGVNFSVRGMVVALVTALVVLTWVEVGEGVAECWREYRDAGQLVEANLAIDRLLQAAQNLAFERGRTNVVLRGAEPIGEDNRAFIAARRRAVAENLDAVLPQLGRKGAALGEEYARLKAVRAEIDRAFALPRAARDPLLAEQWFDTASEMLVDLGRVMATVTLRREQVTPLFRVFSRLKVQSFELRDALGQESSRIAANLAAGRPMDRLTSEEVMRLRGRGAAVWAGMQRERELAANPGVDAAVQAVDAAFFNTYRPLEDKVLAAARDGGPMPVTVAELTGASVPALNSIAALMSVLTTESTAYADRNMIEAGHSLTLHLALVAVSLALGIAALVMVIDGLLRPLRAVAGQLDALARGDTSVEPTPVGRGEEMLRISRAVRSFRDSLVERRCMTEEMAHLSRQTQLILDCAGDGIIGLDAEGHAMFLNPAARRMLGWRIEDFAGRTHHELVHHTHADGAPFPCDDCPVHKTLIDGHQRHCPEDVFWCRNGDALVVAYSVDAIVEQGRVQGAVIVFRDIGDARRAAAERDLLLSDLKRSNADLEQFAYAVSHDLQEPLRTVTSHVQLLARRLGDRLDTDLVEVVDFAVGGTKRMASMINALLEFARVGSRPGEVKPLAAGTALAHALENLSAAITDSGATLQCAPLPEVLADQTQLTALFQNLIGNAIKYRSPDRPAVISVAATTRGGEVELSVADNGPGIPAGERRQVFGVFHRFDARPDIDGLGMGLAICKRIVDRHHGRIWVEDNPGGGARFVFTLPVAAGAHRAHPL
jgi:PAS domain S-box-containing protein